MKFKRVPAIDKCFQILEFFEKKGSLRISEISNGLDLNKSTVFNIVHTLTELGVLENFENMFRFGPRLYVLGRSAQEGSDLIRYVHPHLKEISRKTNLSAFLGIRSGFKVMILDKSESTYDLKISSEIGIRIPLVAGAHGKAFLSLLQDEQIKAVLSDNRSLKYIQRSGMSQKAYFNSIKKVKKDGFAYENEEYLEGIRALAIPLKLYRKDFHCAVWAVGFKNLIKEESIKEYSDFLKQIAIKIEHNFS